MKDKKCCSKNCMHTGWCCCCCCCCCCCVGCWNEPLLVLLELSDVAADDDDEVPWNMSKSSYLRLATVKEMIPGTGPSSCIAFLRVSMADGLCLPSNEIPFMLTWKESSFFKIWVSKFLKKRFRISFDVEMHVYSKSNYNKLKPISKHLLDLMTF